MAFQNLEEKFAYALGAVLSSEQVFVESQHLEERVTDAELKALLSRHTQDTQGQLTVLTQIFELLGKAPEAVPSAGTQGMVQDASAFAEESANVAAFYDCAVADAQVKAEAYEVACYRALVVAAQQMDRDDIVQLLSQNLDQEEQTQQALEQMIPRLALVSFQAQQILQGQNLQEIQAQNPELFMDAADASPAPEGEQPQQQEVTTVAEQQIPITDGQQVVTPPIPAVPQTPVQGLIDPSLPPDLQPAQPEQPRPIPPTPVSPVLDVPARPE